MATIRLTKRFLRSERDKAYSSWTEAFWREMFQNSIDAGADIVRINIFEASMGTVIRFDDNGRGMTPDVVENVFFRLGESYKDNDNSVGGFGRARLLTCLSMDSYSFKTGNLLCNGNGDEYEITETSESKSGCVFEIVIGDAATTCKMDEKLRSFLSFCQMDCKVFINDIQWKSWLYKRRLVRCASFGDIHYNKSGYSSNYIFVRVNGVCMFKIFSSIPGQVIVEIDPKKSRDILLINRDGFGHGYEQELTRWVQEISIDKRSALLSHRRKTKLIKGMGVRLSRRIRKVVDTVIDVVENEVPDVQHRVKENLSSVTKDVQKEVREFVDSDNFSMDMLSVFINDEFSDRHILRRKINEYDPMNWEIACAHGSSYRKGGNRRKLLLVWEVACEEAIRCLIDIMDYEELSWLIGWEFSDSAEASHMGLSEGHAFCLNPIDSEGKMRYRLGSRKDQKKLTALAKHEVAHVVYSFHDESYANLLTEIDAKYSESRVFKAMKNALKTS